jgi:Uma2 family endonuclease
MKLVVEASRIVGRVCVPLHHFRRAEHIMAMPALRRRWTAQERHELVDRNPLATPRYELVDGELLVTPSPTSLHQDGAALLLHALYRYLIENPIGHAYTAPLDVELEPELILQPDDFVVPIHEHYRLRREAGPARELLVAAEIASPSSSRFDHVTKREPYQRHVSEYWIVDLDARIVERWQPNDERPRILADELVWHPAGAAAPFRLNLPRYFATILDD